MRHRGLSLLLVMVAHASWASAAEPVAASATAAVPGAEAPSGSAASVVALTSATGEDPEHLAGLLLPIVAAMGGLAESDLVFTSRRLRGDGFPETSDYYRVDIAGRKSGDRLAYLTMAVKDGKVIAIRYHTMDPFASILDDEGSHDDRLPGPETGGLTFGGMLGIAVSGHFGGGRPPFVDGAIGISGIRGGIGMLFTANGDEPWCAYHSVHTGETSRREWTGNAAVGVRAVIVHRWFGQDAHRPEAIFGVRTRIGNYLGIEGIATLGGLSVIPGVYAATRGRETLWAVAYGVGF